MGANQLGDRQPTGIERLFLALFPPVGAVDHLRRRLGREPAVPAERRIAPKRLHVTLAFLGPVPEERRVRLLRELSDCSHGLAAPQLLRLAGAGAFGRGVAWVGLRAADDDAPRALQADVRALRRACRSARCQPDDSLRWRPHLTIARIRPSDPTAARGLATALSDYRGPDWRPASYTLVASTGGPRPEYSRLADFPLPPVETEV
ncbi:MAG: hypothetical protein RLZ55_95 [Actinomycetota bacterium]|jgi:2'-5' RNA ligase